MGPRTVYTRPRKVYEEHCLHGAASAQAGASGRSGLAVKLSTTRLTVTMLCLPKGFCSPRLRVSDFAAGDVQGGASNPVMQQGTRTSRPLRNTLAIRPRERLCGGTIPAP